MNILVILGAVWPLPSNNSNIIKKLLPHISDSNCVHILAFLNTSCADTLPGEIEGFPVHWVTDCGKDLKRKIWMPLIAKAIDRNGFSDAIQAMVLCDAAREIRKTFSYDCVFSTMEPYYSGLTGAMLPPSVKKVMYLLDPPGCVCDEDNNTAFRQKYLRYVFNRYDCVLTTTFIKHALMENGYTKFEDKFHEVGFPLIHSNSFMQDDSSIQMDKEKINILFCGWLCSDIRSPKYFLDIASSLDERFCIYFMGKECDKLRERFDFETRAQVITLPQQPYQVALNAMADADVLINIGNSVPVHMPSKTLEYINTGKPIVNFHKLSDCPTLHYTSRYPLCLNLWEGEKLSGNTIDAFIRFCTDNKGRTIDTSNLVKQFPDCTPEYISNLILEKFGANYD